jgi:hypothetical protein
MSDNGHDSTEEVGQEDDRVGEMDEKMDDERATTHGRSDSPSAAQNHFGNRGKNRCEWDFC